MTVLPDALRGPWVAVRADAYGAVLGDLDLEAEEYVEISVVRCTAAPVDGELPGSYSSADVLYRHEAEDDQDLADRWEQAQAVADALNALAEPESAAIADLRGEVDRLHALLAERDTTPAGPADDASVWMSAGRTGLDMHGRTAGTATRTTCGRSTRTGVWHTAAFARAAYQAKPCPRCWPGAAT